MMEELRNSIAHLKLFGDVSKRVQVRDQEGCSMSGSSNSVESRVEDGKQFLSQEKGNNILKFPFHHYLRQHYNKLSLQQQIHIFQWYFKTTQKCHQIVLQESHIKILNEGLNLFTKLPQAPFLFLLIQQYNETKQIMTIKDQNGEIFHFQILEQKKKRCTVVGEIKRKLKGRGFIVINDKSKLPQAINMKTLNKLGSHSNYLYRRVIKNRKQCEHLKSLFFQTNNSQIKQEYYKKIDLQNGKIMIMNLVGEKFYACCFQQKYSLKYQDFQNFKIYYYHLFQLIRNHTRAIESNVRLRIFDYLYINFLKSTFKNKKQFITTIQDMGKKLAIKTNQNPDTENDHFAQKIFNSRRCKCCEVLERGKNKKSKFKCIGCSIRYQTDIPLCIGCFGDFHEEILPKSGKIGIKKIKKAYQLYLKKQSEKQDNLELKKEMEKNIQNNEQVRDAILKLNQNMSQMQSLMGQLQDHSILGATIVKELNQAMFLNIIKSFNCILEHKFQSQMPKQNDQSYSQNDGVGQSNSSNIDNNN